MNSIVIKCLSGLMLTISISACTGKSMNKEATTVYKAETYTLIRDWKRVIRFDCQGKVVSDKTETIRAPNQYVSIAPKTSFNLYSAAFKNLTNQATAPMTTNLTSFTIDIAPTLLNLKVEEGINQLEYRFYYCDELKKNELNERTGDCVHQPALREEGTLFIKVLYQQNFLEGFDEVKPPTEDCKKTP